MTIIRDTTPPARWEPFLTELATPPTEPAGAFRVRVEDVRLPPNVTAGMNALRLMALAYRMRGTTSEVEGPITVRPEAGGWRVVDGRHRFLAAVIAGRPDVLAVTEQQ